MKKIKQSIFKKLRKLNHSFSVLNPLIARLDKGLGINIDETARRYPKNKTIAVQQRKAKAALSCVLNGINCYHDFSINKKIWIYWNSGLDSAPEVVKVAVKSWSAKNPDFELIFLDDKKIQEYFDFESLFMNLTINAGVAHKSDFIRTYLLARFGGVWVDSTTFCWEPLSNWIDQSTAKCGFFVFKQSADRLDRQIKNWFIASSKGNPIIVEMLKNLVEYNFKPRAKTLGMVNYSDYAHFNGISREGTGFDILNKLELSGSFPYFYYHYLFNEAVQFGIPNKLWKIAKLTLNDHVNSTGNIGTAKVSKQNYRKKYMQSSSYIERKIKIECWKD